MQSTAKLQHTGENHGALEQIEYYLDGIQNGVGMAKSMFALKLADICSNSNSTQSSNILPNLSNGRLLLRATSGLTQCIKLIEELIVEENVESYEHIYCMMTLLYFISLDTENCDAITGNAFTKLIDILRIAACNPWNYNHPAPAISPINANGSKKHALLRKKSVPIRSATTTISLLHQAQGLLRTDKNFESHEWMAIVTLCDITLGILNNLFQTDHAINQYGMENAKKSLPLKNSLSNERKLLLRKLGGLDILAQLIQVSYKNQENHNRGMAYLFHTFRLVDQLSFMERGTQDHFVLETNILTSIFHVITDHATINAGKQSSDLYLMALRVLINLTHKNDIACANVAAIHGTHTSLHVLLMFLLADHKEKINFDTCLLSVSALINCVEHNETNRDDVATYRPNLTVLDTLVKNFLSVVSAFEHVLLEPDESTSWNPEDVILSGSLTMLLGCLMRGRPIYARHIVQLLPGGSPQLLIRVLVAFVGLHAQIGALSDDILESCVQVESELKELMKDGPCTDDGILSTIAHLNPKRKPALAIDATSVDFTTPQRAISVQGNTPPASAFKFGNYSAPGDVSSPKSLEIPKRQATTQVLGAASIPTKKQYKRSTSLWTETSPDIPVRVFIRRDSEPVNPTFKKHSRSQHYSTKHAHEIEQQSSSSSKRTKTPASAQPTFSKKSLSKEQQVARLIGYNRKTNTRMTHVKNVETKINRSFTARIETKSLSGSRTNIVDTLEDINPSSARSTSVQRWSESTASTPDNTRSARIEQSLTNLVDEEKTTPSIQRHLKRKDRTKIPQPKSKKKLDVFSFDE